jgi:hypothetical protein
MDLNAVNLVAMLSQFKGFAPAQIAEPNRGLATFLCGPNESIAIRMEPNRARDGFTLERDGKITGVFSGTPAITGLLHIWKKRL